MSIHNSVQHETSFIGNNQHIIRDVGSGEGAGGPPDFVRIVGATRLPGLRVALLKPNYFDKQYSLSSFLLT